MSETKTGHAAQPVIGDAMERAWVTPDRSPAASVTPEGIKAMVDGEIKTIDERIKTLRAELRELGKRRTEFRRLRPRKKRVVKPKGESEK